MGSPIPLTRWKRHTKEVRKCADFIFMPFQLVPDDINDNTSSTETTRKVLDNAFLQVTFFVSTRQKLKLFGLKLGQSPSRRRETESLHPTAESVFTKLFRPM